MIRVVSGHICSGKSTFVRQHAAASDLVIDCDRLALALAPEGTEPYGFAAHHREVARRTRWHAIDEAVRLHRKPGGFDVWIVHAYPSPDDLARYRRLGASIREMEAEPDLLIERAKASRPPAWIDSLTAALAAGAMTIEEARGCQSGSHP